LAYGYREYSSALAWSWKAVVKKNMRAISVCVIASIWEGQVKLKNTFSHPLLRKATKSQRDQEGEMIKKGENKQKTDRHIEGNP
jgi:hypothetical protein